MSVIYAALCAIVMAIAVSWIAGGDGMVALGQVIGALNTFILWAAFETVRR
jgi:hypothetical protein